MPTELRMAILAGALTAALVAPLSASALTVDVFARENSSSGGTGVPTIVLTTGDAFSVTAGPGDLWNAGDLPRWSNADGLVGDLFATGSDDSGQPAGTKIGTHFPDWKQGNLTAPYGSLVGSIGGIYALLGTSFNGAAWGTGTLNLWYWDENNGDNSQKISVTIRSADEPGPDVVPEPATVFLLGSGLLGLARANRRKA